MALTIPYKQIQGSGHHIHLDLYPPSHLRALPDQVPNVPALVYFHGGGLTVGNRTSWFPEWLKKRVVDSGYAFISADYQLIPPATAHDILEDIKDVFAFVSSDLNAVLDANLSTDKFHVDGSALAVAGSSAGGLCAYLAAIHVEPRPRAVLCIYPMLGDGLTPHHLNVKTEVFFRGRELLDPTLFTTYLYPFPKQPLLPITDSPLAYDPPTAPIPGYPSNPRMLVGRLYIQLGVYLDYYTGQHTPSLSATLRKALESNHEDHERCMRELVPPTHQALFPQLGVTSSWPPTFLIHGSIDSAVPVNESCHMRDLLQRSGVPVRLEVVDGQEHSFDYERDAENKHGAMFDEVKRFLEAHLGTAAKSDAVIS